MVEAAGAPTVAVGGNPRDDVDGERRRPEGVGRSRIASQARAAWRPWYFARATSSRAVASYANGATQASMPGGGGAGGGAASRRHIVRTRARPGGHSPGTQQGTRHRRDRAGGRSAAWRPRARPYRRGTTPTPGPIRVTVTPGRYVARSGRRGCSRPVAPAAGGSPRRPRRRPAPRGHGRGRAARGPRQRRLGQDARAHASDRVARPRGTPRPRPRARGHVHTQGGRASSPHDCVASASAVRSPRARSTRSRSRSCGDGRSTRAEHPPEVLERKVRILLPIVGRVTGRRGPEATLAATDTAGEIEWAKTRLLRPAEYAVAARRSQVATRTSIQTPSPRSTTSTSTRSGVGGSPTSRTSCGGAPTRSTATPSSPPRNDGGSAISSSTSSRTRARRSCGWCARGSGDRADLCVVGDPDQAIYAFAGGESGFLARFGRTFPGGEVVHLRTNYRCAPEIVAAAGALLADGGGRRPVVRSVRHRPARPRSPSTRTKRPRRARSRNWRAMPHTGGRRWSELAVLYRTNAQSAAFEEAFARDRHPVPGARRGPVPRSTRGEGRARGSAHARVT